ncbi:MULTISPECIES: DUF2141 domain-containing protein [Nostoc]|jgi:uncharacterized protein (DUF2141 family)|uniref:DUF2141 domain-containing protein n=1 Tax=Nostoc punctiforme FACHB-252 TaxID=1357509 RepID=A0ABR8H9C4_NOSPU|nr:MULTISPECIES: DUF2141 domain-containing protein [Nostoc]MBC1238915.1 DUF2141 domain-containing protein [Nostoc sp. 2RC]MBD2611856.1 DUF2141 domain-containing protein [Nostoc punctiforme FACHB-252]MBL1198136.1 DUF2141 domain-containing protein [Nostoc sp. GBBB01]MDZ8015851.1 DUF2141 domain-containing protein [Nostoc sp. ZfuVER08]
MLKLSHLSYFLLATLMGISFAKSVNAEPTAKLNIVVNGIRHQKGEICFRVFGGEKGFPMSNTSEVKSGCAKITGSSVTKEFSGLKPGTYAVAVVDDQNGDRKLNKDFFGIPTEGFGLSKNPTVSIQTGTPKFRDASFVVNKNTTVNIRMKYSLDS